MLTKEYPLFIFWKTYIFIEEVGLNVVWDLEYDAHFKF